MADHGIDISHWNAVDDWQAVHGDDIVFCSHKVTEGVDHVDAQAAQKIPAARDAGIAVGGYHFARPGDVAAQVDHFTRLLTENDLLTDGSFVPMLDVEAAELRDGADAFVGDFVNRFRKAAGVGRIAVYSNLDWYQHVLKPDGWADDEVFCWVARFNGDPGNPGWSHSRLALHQHTDRGSVAGIPGGVDRNVTLDGFGVGDLTLG
ncbi:glycoside hydrolase family 25 protein [Actinoalloteichus hymeniacidonis]|uniref:Lysozyme M1 (1,4-beta-N-acetylmuramidase) n=1 Tax=Actinoalloteichus hymeniacidonis TaxID=340345 RepID=A0AAC9HQ72_9PSEU|nr:glycoside hydrolase family 25 protein [Actinoalloteichus hymeniacidonis]AOS63469.1 lysozyme M1 (1,4-beta-N-acetylmuramidase) [Actinoalloteichus hymeniacidonis]MBB5908488.1 GH25 family lysozyme M1 (1,4-beta-N-acetylmuramidase) [Actinoalloteichus hymeniacidonis]